MSSAAVYTHVVYIVPPDSLVPVRRTVCASYFTEKGSYTVFKDTEHKVVRAFRTDMTMDIERTEPA